MDPTTLGALATGAVSILSPYLAKVADAVAPKVAGDLYALLRDKLARKPAAAEALQDLEKAPADADTQAALRLQLKKVLAEDEDLVAQLQKLVEQAGRPAGGIVRASDRGVAAGGDISGQVFTGDIGGSVHFDGGKPPSSRKPGEP
ncbi:MAG TPA: hypothetical protein VF498_03600 [Anaerolineales bacterium]